MDGEQGVDLAARPRPRARRPAPMPSARRPAPLTSAPSSIWAAPRAAASSARAAAASGSAARSTSSQRTTAPSALREAELHQGGGEAARLGAHGVAGPRERLERVRARAHRDHARPQAARLADAQLDDRLLVGRVAADDHHEPGARRCRRAGPRAARGAPPARRRARRAAARPRRAGPRGRAPGPGSPPRPSPSGPTRTPDPAGAPPSTSAAASTASSRLTCRTRPSSWMTADGEPVGGVVAGVGEAREVREPALLHRVVRVRPAGDPRDLALAGGELHVGAGGVVAADRGGVGDVPGPRDEAVGDARQRADGAEVDDVAGEAALVVVAGEGADLAAGAAVLHDQRAVLGDLLAEAHAAEARDAPLAVERDERREVERLREVALGLDEARVAAART